MNIELNTVKLLKVFVCSIWWQVPGVGNTGLQCKLSSYLFNVSIHVRSKLNVSLPPYATLHLEFLFLRNVFQLMKVAQIIADQRAQASLPALLGYFGGNVFWRGVKWQGIMEEWKNGQTIHVFKYLFFSCHLGSHYCWLNTVLDRSYSTFHLTRTGWHRNPSLLICPC